VSRVSVKDVLFYGGLGALTEAGALDWLVALAVGGDALVLRGRRKGRLRKVQEPEGDSWKQE
jgi:hypothetical protein